MCGSLQRIPRLEIPGRCVVGALLALVLAAAACSGDESEPALAPAGPTADAEAPSDEPEPEVEVEVEVDDGSADDRSRDAAAVDEAGVDDNTADEVRERMTMATFVPTLAGPHVAIVVDDRACDGSSCLTVLELQVDGQWLLLGPDGSEQAGGFDSQELVELASGLAVDEVVVGPFTGQCPTESGGSERFYRVFSGDGSAGQTGEETIVLDVSTCVDRIDADARIIVALDLLLAEILDS